MNIKKKLNEMWYDHFEFDRVAERKIKKSMDLWQKGGSINHLHARILCNKIRSKYCCKFYPTIKAGKNFRIEHCMYANIGRTAEFGDNVSLYSGVSILAKITGDNARLQNNERRHAKVGNDVVLGDGCTIIGPVTIGDDCIIGARAIVTHDVPPHSVVIGTNKVRPKREDECKPSYKQK